MVAAITRLPQGAVGSLRAEVAQALGLGPPDALGRTELDAVEAECLRRLELCQRWRWDHDAAVAAGGPDEPGAPLGLRAAGPVARPPPPARSGRCLAALDGRFVAPGPSGAPSRGMAHVLPTGRNFYALDPRAVPSRLAWDVGRRLADRLSNATWPRRAGYPTRWGWSCGGRAAMRTGGDDIAEALALLGVRPRWAEGSGRVEGVELIPSARARPAPGGRHRCGSRGSSATPSPTCSTCSTRRSRLAATAPDEGGDEPGGPGRPRRAPGLRAQAGRLRFGHPGPLGIGRLAGRRRPGRGLRGLGGLGLRGRGRAPARPPTRSRSDWPRIEVAVKNQDNREHDIFDSDDYLQDHGGMVAAVRALSGRQPKALFGDSANPARPRVRSLAEEAARVVRTPGAQPEVAGGHGAARLQGGLRDGGDRRLPVRLRRHRGGARGLDVRAGDRDLRR